MANLNSTFASPALQSTGVGLDIRPGFAPPGQAGLGLSNTNTPLDPGFSPGSSRNVPTDPALIGTGGPSVSSTPAIHLPAPAGLNLQDVPQSQASPVLYNATSGKLWVNGFQFDQGDVSSAFNSTQYLRTPSKRPPPTGPDWRPMALPEYNAYLDRLQHPGLIGRFQSGLEGGIRGIGETGAGAWLALDHGNNGVKAWRANLENIDRQQAPLNMSWEDIHNPYNFLEYASNMLGQAAPWLAETAIEATAGAAAGAAIGGPGGALAGAAEGAASATGETLTRNALLRSIRSGISLYDDAKDALHAEGMAGATAEQIGQRAVLGATAEQAADIQNAMRFGAHLQLAQRAGAGALLTLGNYRTALGDTYGQIQDSGISPGQEGAATGNAMAWAVPYAVSETLTDWLGLEALVGRGFGHVPTNLLGRSVRIAGHAAVGGLTEGGEEAAQQFFTDTAVQQTNGQTIEQQHQNVFSDYSNQFAGGAVPGVLLGGLAGLRGGHGAPRASAPHDLLSPPAAPTTPVAPTPTPPYRGPTTGGPGTAPDISLTTDNPPAGLNSIPPDVNTAPPVSDIQTVRDMRLGMVPGTVVPPSPTANLNANPLASPTGAPVDVEAAQRYQAKANPSQASATPQTPPRGSRLRGILKGVRERLANTNPEETTPAPSPIPAEPIQVHDQPPSFSTEQAQHIIGETQRPASPEFHDLPASRAAHKTLVSAQRINAADQNTLDNLEPKIREPITRDLQEARKEFTDRGNEAIQRGDNLNVGPYFVAAHEITKALEKLKAPAAIENAANAFSSVYHIPTEKAPTQTPSQAAEPPRRAGPLPPQHTTGMKTNEPKVTLKKTEQAPQQKTIQQLESRVRDLQEQKKKAVSKSQKENNRKRLKAAEEELAKAKGETRLGPGVSYTPSVEETKQTAEKLNEQSKPIEKKIAFPTEQTVKSQLFKDYYEQLLDKKPADMTGREALWMEEYKKLTQEKNNAVQEPSPAPLDVREQTGNGKTVGEGHATQQTPPAARTTNNEPSAGSTPQQVQPENQAQPRLTTPKPEAPTTMPKTADEIKAAMEQVRAQIAGEPQDQTYEDRLRTPEYKAKLEELRQEAGRDKTAWTKIIGRVSSAIGQASKAKDFTYKGFTAPTWQLMKEDLKAARNAQEEKPKANLKKAAAASQNRLKSTAQEQAITTKLEAALSEQDQKTRNAMERNLLEQVRNNPEFKKNLEAYVHHAHPGAYKALAQKILDAAKPQSRGAFSTPSETPRTVRNPATDAGIRIAFEQVTKDLAVKPDLHIVENIEELRTYREPFGKKNAPPLYRDATEAFNYHRGEGVAVLHVLEEGVKNGEDRDTVLVEGPGNFDNQDAYFFPKTLFAPDEATFNEQGEGWGRPFVGFVKNVTMNLPSGHTIDKLYVIRNLLIDRFAPFTANGFEEHYQFSKPHSFVFNRNAYTNAGEPNVVAKMLEKRQTASAKEVGGYERYIRTRPTIIIFRENLPASKSAFVIAHEIYHPAFDEIVPDNMSIEQRSELGIGRMEAQLRMLSSEQAKDAGVNKYATGREALLEWVRWKSPEVRARALQYEAHHDMDRITATTEAIIDRSADLHLLPPEKQTVLQRFWEIIRKGLELLGLHITSPEAGKAVERLQRNIYDKWHGWPEYAPTSQGDWYLYELSQRMRSFLEQGYYEPPSSYFSFGQGNIEGPEGERIFNHPPKHLNLAEVKPANQNTKASSLRRGNFSTPPGKPPSAKAVAKQDMAANLASVATGAGGHSYIPHPFQVPGYAEAKNQEYKEAALEAVKAAGNKVDQAVKYVQHTFETMSNLALRSKGAELVQHVMSDIVTHAHALMNKWSALRPLDNFSTPQLDWAGRAQQWGDRHFLPHADKLAEAAPSIMTTGLGGEYQVDRAAAMAVASRLTKDDIKNGVQLYATGPHGPVKIAGPKGTLKYEGKAEDFDKSYEAYTNERNAIETSIIDGLAERLAGLNGQRSDTIHELTTDHFDASARADAVSYLNKVLDLYKSVLQNAKDRVVTNKKEGDEKALAIKSADKLLVALLRPLHSAEKLNDWQSGATGITPEDQLVNQWRDNPDLAARYPGIKDIISQMPRVSGKGVDLVKQVKIKNSIATLATNDEAAKNFENVAKQFLIGHYAPLRRPGKFEVFVEVQKPDGTPADVPQWVHDQLTLSHANSRLEAEKLAEELTQGFAGEHDMVDNEGNQFKAQLVPSVRLASQRRTLTAVTTSNQVESILKSAGVNVTPRLHEKLTTLLDTLSGRQALSQTGTPGYGNNQIRYDGDFLTTQAWSIAGLAKRQRIDDIMGDSRNWYGDWQVLKTLQKAHDDAANAPVGYRKALRFQTGQALMRYARQMEFMAPWSAKNPTFNVTENGKEHVITKKGDRGSAKARDQVQRIVELAQSGANLQNATENPILHNPVTRLGASALMLGGNVAGALVNSVSAFTNTPVYLAGYNDKTGYGGGHGWARTSEAMGWASRTVMLNKGVKQWEKGIIDQDWIEQALEGKVDARGLDKPALQFIHEEMVRGIFQPAMNNNLTAGTDNAIANKTLKGVFKIWMKFFGDAERVNRMVTGLASRRLEMERMIAAGEATKSQLEDVESPEHQEMVSRVEKAIRYTQFDYNRSNKPKLFQGPLGEAVFQFKMFAVSMMELVYNLPRREQIIMLGALFLMAGVKGEPFAQDLMDLYDTLLQKLGIRHDSVELELAKLSDSIIPGSAPWLLNGAVDQFSGGATVSSRLGMGDMIPFTGIGREGADFGQEVRSALGPAYSAAAATTDWAFTLASFAAGAAGLSPDGASGDEVLRKIPASGLRSLADAYMIARDGQITDSHGRLVQANPNFMNIVTRAMGFYPQQATIANDTTRLSHYHDGYMQAVRARFTLKYADALRHNDTAEQARITQDVQDWNQSAVNSGRPDMQITNFQQSARRANEAVTQTLAQRKSSSQSASDITEEVARILNADGAQ